MKQEDNLVIKIPNEFVFSTTPDEAVKRFFGGEPMHFSDFSRRRFLATAGASTLSVPAFGQDLGREFLSRRAVSDTPMTAIPNDIYPFSDTTLLNGPADDINVAITFDDGPHPTLTPRLLDILKQRGLTATFFVIGVMARAYPDVLRRIADEGHEIGNHTFRHPNLSDLSDQRVFDEIDRTTDIVDRIVKAQPTTMRPPYGSLTRRQRRILHETRKLPTVLWSIDPRDWRRPGASVVRDRILHRIHNGAIILAHDIHRGTIDAMPETLDGLIASGFEFKTVSDLVGLEHWAPDPLREMNLISLM